MALLTQHGKEHVIAPVLEPALGCRIERVGGFDTDLLGTFTREIPRAVTQIEAARRKARLGMALSGWPLGIGSEGAFGPDPVSGLLACNLEFLLCIDDALGLEVVGQARGNANFAQGSAADWPAAEAFARRWGFPQQHLVLRPQGPDDPRIRKGISSWAQLETDFGWARAQSPGGLVFLETDLRAHANPARRESIRLAAKDLVARLRSPCPECGAPGFWTVGRLPGLPCEDCRAPTRQPQADVLGCVKCAHRVTRQRTDRHSADAAHCDFCNP